MEDLEDVAGASNGSGEPAPESAGEPPAETAPGSGVLGNDVEPSAETAIMPKGTKYGTFAGVFVPTLLTILGVIMYLRTGWVVGNAGLIGSLLVIGLAFGIVTATGLSMSSITTNIRIGAGGAYSIISQSLGLEVGGAVGIPLYLAQALAVTMYIFGFREGWLWVFPDHTALLVDLSAFVLIFGIAYISASLAFRVQYVILAVIVTSLISVAVAAATGSMVVPFEEIQLWGDFPGAPEDNFPGVSFWVVFAVFFPAATGIMAGANMSGELKNPRTSIPLGTMSAIGLSFVIYVLIAIWLLRSAPTEELLTNYTVMIDMAYWGAPVVAGLLGATFSSALASAVGAPRILQALGNHDILPASSWMSQRTDAGEPRNAMMITGGLVLAALMVRDLNAIAPLITMFFLITYTMINVVVFVEQTLGLVSFRPILRLPRTVSFAGAAGCLLAMFIVNPTFGLAALAIVVVFYGVLVRRTLDHSMADVRSGLFVSLAEWAAKKVKDLSSRQERAWKPNILVPIRDADTLRGSFLFVQDLAAPKGAVNLLGLDSKDASDDLARQIEDITSAFRKRGVFASSAVVSADRFAPSLTASIQTMQGAFFKPNILFLPLPDDDELEGDYGHLVHTASDQQMGTCIYAPHRRAGLGQRETVNVWINDRSPDWKVSMDIGNLDLPVLMAYKLKRNWNAEMRLLTVVRSEEQADDARAFLHTLTDLARMPEATAEVHVGDFESYLEEAPRGDVNIFGLMDPPNFARMREIVTRTRTSGLFVRDSGTESALA
ncbi:amino acid permease [Longibacter salinarum]|nr:amino acid permease [Longibacter salinarum]